MTGSASDPADWQPHIRSKPRPRGAGQALPRPDDPFKLVIVRDMWLTGFDAPEPAHHVHRQADAGARPDAGHRAREPRVRDKPGGLVVDYLGLAQELKKALAHLHRERRHRAHGARPGRGRGRDAGEVRGLLRLFHGFDWASGRPARRQSGSACCRPRRSTSWPGDGKERCVGAVRELSQAFALAVPHDEALRIRDDVAFFQAVQACSPSARPATPARGGHRARGAADHLARRGARGRDRHLRRGGARRSPTSRSCPTSSSPRCAACRSATSRSSCCEAAQGRTGHAAAQERRAGALVRRDAGADDPPLPEPRDRGGAGDRGADRAGEGDARSARTRRGAAAVRGRTGLLRRAGNQRQRREGARRRTLRDIARSW
jgi:hypothetical protein